MMFEEHYTNTRQLEGELRAKKQRTRYTSQQPGKSLLNDNVPSYRMLLPIYDLNNSSGTYKVLIANYFVYFL